MYLDFKMEPGATLTQAIPEGWNGFIYTLKGKGLFGKRLYCMYLLDVTILLNFWQQNFEGNVLYFPVKFAKAHNF